MAHIGTSKKIKQYPDPKDTSKMVKYHLGWGQYMDQNKREFLDVTVNGYPYHLEFGKTHEVPEDVLKVAEQARIRYVKNSPLSRFEHAVGGQGRPQSEAMHPSQEMADIPFYNVIRL